MLLEFVYYYESEIEVKEAKRDDTQLCDVLPFISTLFSKCQITKKIFEIRNVFFWFGFLICVQTLRLIR